MNEQALLIQLKPELLKITKELLKGNHIEIHTGKDGVRIFSVNKKILK